MEFKGTPAPWLCMNGTDVFTELNATNASGIKSDKTDGWQIADCSVGKTCVDGEYIELSVNEQIANAHLIAAAPELLEALIEMQRNGRKQGWNDIYESSMGKTRLAIAKALGHQYPTAPTPERFQ
ncbi:hypothetical protein HMPREF1562_0016 [Providencia alcalifaciens F90-2004]|uniref:hypothetical protein n=1 Tax=Providencia alcalifaciens TaxID=126385 RepID=UPI00045071A7|nr:hypothetical protein [Providencia alcalifaciens]ETT05683.1 hypothetical protein HMPREF1562_0016 [Providencia alcalifaciens F90-2004]